MEAQEFLLIWHLARRSIPSCLWTWTPRVRWCWQWVLPRHFFPRLTDFFCPQGTIFIRACHSLVDSTTTFPRDPDYRERFVHQERKGQHASQVGEEPFQVCVGLVHYGDQFVWCKGSGQVCRVCWVLCLVIFHISKENKKLDTVWRCSIPLCYVYPSMVHLRACARNRKQKAVDYAMIVFGIVCCVYTSVQTLKVCLCDSMRRRGYWGIPFFSKQLMLAPNEPPEITYCDV